MAKIQGDLGQALADILDVSANQVQIDELRDLDGVSIVYELGQLARAQLFAMDTRAVVATGIIASEVLNRFLDGLGPLFALQNIVMGVSDSTRIESLDVFMDDVGAIGSATRSDLLWHWESGDPVISRPANFTTGNANVPDLLVPTKDNVFFQRGDPIAMNVNANRQGAALMRIELKATAFGAGTVDLQGQIVTGFHRGLGSRTVPLVPLP